MTEVEAPARPRRSYSQLSLYLECPLAFYRKYIERIPEEPAIWSIGGTAFHTCAEWLLNGTLRPNGTGDRIRDAWLAAWQIAANEVAEKHPGVPIEEYRCGNQGREDLVWWLREGPAMVARFVEWRETTGQLLEVVYVPERQPLLEYRLEVELGGVPVVAIPDAVVIDEHGQLGILDYKSGRRLPRGSLQLGVYAAALLVGLGVQATWGFFYSTRKAELTPHLLTSWTPEVIGQMFADFEANVAAGRFDPRPGHKCIDCRTTH